MHQEYAGGSCALYRRQFGFEDLRCYPTIPSVFPLIDTGILRRSGARDAPSGNVSLNTICIVVNGREK